MFKVVFCVLRITALSIGFSLPSLAQGEGVGKRVKISYAYPDQVIFTTKKKLNGDMDSPLFKVADVLFERAGIPWGANQYPAARMFRKLNSGEENFSILVASPLLNDCCVVSKKPVVTTQIRVYYKAGASPITNLSDLKNKRVITIAGYSYGSIREYLTAPENNISVLTTATHQSAFTMLNYERAEYLVDYKHPSLEVLDEQPIKGIQYSTLRDIGLFLVLHKSYPNAQDVIARLESILGEIDVDAILDLPEDP